MIRWACIALALVACEDSRRSRAHEDRDGDELGRISKEAARVWQKRDAAKRALVAARCAGLDCYPDVTIVDIDGREHTRADLDGKVVIVELWASWSTASVEMLTTLQRLVDHYVPLQLFVVAVSTEGDSYSARHTATSRNVTYPMATFDALQSHYETPSYLPATYIYDRTGRRVTNRMGAYGLDELELIVDGLLL